MIKSFLRTKFGQILIVGFSVATIIAGIMCWIYESIRIPALIEQRDASQRTVTELQEGIQKEKDRSKNFEQSVELEKANLQGANLRLDQKEGEIKRLADRLVEVQARHAELLKEIEGVKLASLRANSTNEFPFRLFVGIAADNEDISLLTIDNYVSELKSLSYMRFSSEMAIFQKTAASHNSKFDPVSFFREMGVVLGNYFGFNIRLEDFRQHFAKIIREHYRVQLASLSPDHSDQFFENVRKKPNALPECVAFLKMLKEDDTDHGWLSRSISSLKGILSDTNSTSQIK